ncbi:MAG: glycoside hydrolase family 13 protein [Paludibacter sp.]|nr:glycoside hydrolase family 13 protein [Paludibacter sp.]
MLKKTLFLFITFVTFTLNAQIERVEPTFWWVGMKNTQLQLLIHGTEICTRSVIIQYPGIKILKVNRACSPNYLFVTLDINPKTTKAGTFDILLKQPDKKDLSFRYELKNRRTDSAIREGFTSADVMYLLMPDRFSNGDPTNDNVDSQPDKMNRNMENGRHGGDIKGIQDHLDYIRELGATAIWCTPMLENNYEKASYHGYAISDYYKIDPRFGSNQEYANFVEASHQKGLKVIVDMVSNHCGIWAWWMNDLPMENWIHQWPVYTQTNYKFSTLKDTHASAIDKKVFVDGWFDKTMPDLNQQNPFLWTYFIQNSIWWVEYANLDGIRMDTYPYNDRNAMATWAKAIMTEYPHFNIVGETGLYNTNDNAFWQKDAFNSLKYNSQLPTVMDFTLQTSLSTCFNEHGKPWEEMGMNRLYNTISNDYLYASLKNILVFVENHDTQRFNNLIKGDLDKFKMAMSYLMTTRGIPQIYYGTEIGMTGNKDKGDGDIRRDFPGGWQGDSINAFSAKGRTAVQNEYYNYLSKLLNWRKDKDVIHNGLLTHYIPENDIYVYFRYNDKEKIMVILNNNLKEISLKTDRFAENLKSFSNGTDVMTGIKYDLSSSIVIPKETTLILELK